VFSLVPLTIAPNLAVDPELTVLGAILIPLSFAYAIFRHQLLGIRTVVHRGVVYALLSALIVTGYSVVVVIIRSINGGGDASPATEAALLVVMAAGVPLVPGARRGAGAVVDRILYPERPDHGNLARDISREVALATSVSDLLKQTLTGLRTGLRLSHAQAVKFSNGDRPETVAVGESPVFSDKQMAQFRATLRHSNQAKLLEGEGINGAVLAGMATGRGETSVLVFLGPRISDEPFNSDDIRLLETVCGVLTTALSRLQLIEELQDQADELRDTNRMLLQLQETERSEVAGFIHDAPLQRVSHVLAEARHAGLNRELVDELETAMHELRNLSSTLSPSMLENLGLIRSLESLAKETEDSGGMRVLFSYGGAGRDTRFLAEEELAAFRIAQEALNNCRKHSRASTVWMTLEVLPDSLTIAIEDNGKGLPPADVPKPLGSFGIGMRSMRARAEQMDGSLFVTANEPHGVRVLAELPRVQQEEITVEAAAS
jgi:signal transduction histidine kinase